MDWESFAKWMEGKIEWQIFMVIIGGALYGIAKGLSSTSSSSSTSASTKPKYEQLTLKTRLSRHSYLTPPEKCYCHSCNREIDMKEWGLYGKHCREIECPYCGSRNVWRRP